MNDLFYFYNKTKDEIFTYLNDNNVSYHYKSEAINIIGEFLNDTVNISIYFDENICVEVTLYLEESEANESRFDYLIDKYKTICDNYFGKPILDNTNHDTKNISFIYENDELELTFHAGNNYTRKLFISFASKAFKVIEKEYIKNYKYQYQLSPKHALMYFLTGVCWGLLMYLINKSNLLIWLIGGLVFGLLFGFFMELTIHLSIKHSFKEPKFKKRINKKYEALESTFKYEKAYECYYYQKLIYLCKIYLCDNGFKLAIYLKPKIKVIDLPLKTFNKALILNDLFYEQGNDIYFFKLIDDKKETIQEIKQLVDEKLNYNCDKFNEFRNKIKDIFIEYNPFNAYHADNNEYMYDNLIEFIAKECFNIPNLSKEELNKIVLDGNEALDVKKIASDLTELIYERVIKDKNLVTHE